MLRLLWPENGAKVCLSTQKQLEFLQMDRKDMVPESFDWLNLERHTDGDHTVPAAVEFVWTGDPDGELVLWEQQDPAQRFCYTGNRVCVRNLKIATAYCWKVRFGEEESEVFTFETADLSPRWIDVEGITNVRDCGGWKTQDGRRIRQGLLFRGSELNSHVQITAQGLDVMRKQLKLKSVLDIRGSTETVLDIYKGEYINIPARPYARYLEDPETNRKIFSWLADSQNYPAYFHCWGGADRTGTIAFLLLALLGVELTDLITDYELTSLSIWGLRSRNTELFRGFMEKLEMFAGNNVQEKTVSFMLTSGVTEAQLVQLKNIFLE